MKINSVTKLSVSILAAAGVALSLSGCHTVSGFGQDVQTGGEVITHVATVPATTTTKTTVVRHKVRHHAVHAKAKDAKAVDAVAAANPKAGKNPPMNQDATNAAVSTEAHTNND
jgi:predicted small secreted protein